VIPCSSTFLIPVDPRSDSPVSGRRVLGSRVQVALRPPAWSTGWARSHGFFLIPVRPSRNEAPGRVVHGRRPRGHGVSFLLANPQPIAKKPDPRAVSLPELPRATWFGKDLRARPRYLKDGAKMIQLQPSPTKSRVAAPPPPTNQKQKPSTVIMGPPFVRPPGNYGMLLAAPTGPLLLFHLSQKTPKDRGCGPQASSPCPWLGSIAGPRPNRPKSLGAPVAVRRGGRRGWQRGSAPAPFEDQKRARVPQPVFFFTRKESNTPASSTRATPAPCSGSAAPSPCQLQRLLRPVRLGRLPGLAGGAHHQAPLAQPGARSPAESSAPARRAPFHGPISWHVAGCTSDEPD